MLSLAEDARFPALSRELGRLGIAVAALSEVRRPTCRDPRKPDEAEKCLTEVEGYTYSLCSNTASYKLSNLPLSVHDEI